MTAAITDDNITVNEVLDSIYSRDTANQPVVTAHGYGIQVKVQHGHLVIRDGIGKHHRERRYPQADRSIRRIIVTGPDGYISLDAFRYCRDHDIAVTTLDPDGQLTAHYAPAADRQDARLIRRQCLAGIEQGSPVGIEITRELLIRKVTGQGDVLIKLFTDMRVSARLYKFAEQMQAAETMTELNDLERFAAKTYFESWVGRVAIQWDARSLMRIPANWLAYQKRKLSASKENTKRHATDPVNAMLNYGYSLGYTECRTACIAHGLNPVLGINHGDRLGRDSLALDILEAVRPEVDAYVLGLTGIGQDAYPFTYRSFTEPYGLPPGTVRITAPLTHIIAEASYAWESTAMNAAQTVVSILNGSANRRGGKSLSLANQKAEFLAHIPDIPAILPDSDWEAFQELLPPKNPNNYSHHTISDRTILAALIYLQRHRMPMAYVPPAFGVSRRTMNNRRHTWAHSGHWPAIDARINEIADRAK